MPERSPRATVPQDASEPRGGDSVSARIAVVLAPLLVGAGSLCFFFSRGLTNLYGDGIAHMEGARRIFDSRTPGYAEIGTVWLPLYHLVVSPLALNDYLWRTGLAGSLVSIAAFVGAAWILFRMALAMNRNHGAAIVALTGFLLCPNMDYLASTPLTEPLAMLWAVLVVYGLFRFQETGSARTLIGSACAAFFGTLTRYDGWSLLLVAALFVLWARSEPWTLRIRHAAIFSALASLGPVLWFLHNAYRFGNPLEFYNGPNSAQAIYAHQLATTGFHYPTDGSLLLSARYYLADLALVIGVWPLELAALGVVAWVVDTTERARRAAALLLLLPFAFYTQSMAYSAIPLYVPSFFPFTYYNLRYGLEMLPAVAILPSFVLGPRLPGPRRALIAAIVVAILFAQAMSSLSSGARELPLVKESVLNTPCRSKREQAAIRFFRSHFDSQTIVLAAGKWPCLIPQAGISYRQTLSEANRKIWYKLRSHPEQWADWLVRGDGDAVDELMRAYPDAFRDFVLVERDQFVGEGSFQIYRRRPR